MEPIMVGDGLAIRPEFGQYVMLEGAHLLWMRELDFFACHFKEKRLLADINKPLNWNGAWTRIDLHENDEGEVIGFNTLHLGSAKGMLSRMFQMVKDDVITLRDFIATTNALSAQHDPNFGFHDELNQYLGDESVANLKLCVLDEEDGELRPLNRELFLSLGGRLLV